MKDVWVTTSKHEVVLHSEDPNAMVRSTMHLTYREAANLYESLSRILTHPSHRAAFIPTQSKKSQPVVIEDGPNGVPKLRVVE